MVVLRFGVILFFIVCVAAWAAVDMPWRPLLVFLVVYLSAMEVLGRVRRRQRRRY